MPLPLTDLAQLTASVRAIHDHAGDPEAQHLLEGRLLRRFVASVHLGTLTPAEQRAAAELLLQLRAEDRPRWCA